MYVPIPHFLALFSKTNIGRQVEKQPEQTDPLTVEH
jgi:hypothetical protein